MTIKADLRSLRWLNTQRQLIGAGLTYSKKVNGRLQGVGLTDIDVEPVTAGLAVAELLQAQAHLKRAAQQLELAHQRIHQRVIDQVQEAR